MSEPATSTVEINGHECRVWTKGKGPRLGVLAGFGGLPRWVPVLDELARSRTVVVPSLPGHPGALGHNLLDNHLDWVIAVRQLVRKAGLDGADLMGSSVGGSFVLELAAIWPQSVRRVAVIAPLGLYDEAEPTADLWAQVPKELPGLLCANPKVYEELKAVPPGANSVEWPIEQTRASEAAARIFWPLGNTRLERRLPLIEAPTLLLWGEHDRVIPRSYAERIRKTVRGRTEIKVIAGAGHLAELDQPKAVAEAVLAWTA